MSARQTCACTNISLMQLFHELKQKFPAVPDHVVTNTISSHCHDKSACEAQLTHEARLALPLAYRHPRPRAPTDKADVTPPAQCPNQHEESPSPTTVINLDNCIAKYCTQSPTGTEQHAHEVKQPAETQQGNDNATDDQSPFNYKILKSNKIKSNLNERLEKVKEKKSIAKPVEPQGECSEERPERPRTLDFIKPNPGIAFKAQQVDNPSVPPAQKPPQSDASIQNTFWQDHGYPLNLSVNVNCHMDLGRNDWMEEYDSPHTITSLNLTVCTPTSTMNSPDCNDTDNQVTVTVSPHPVRTIPRRRAPPPPPCGMATASEDQTTPTDTTIDRSLIERQKARLSQLSSALEQERTRLQQLRRETAILSGCGPVGVRGLREEVALLRQQCDSLVKQIELNVTERGMSDGRGGFYNNIYTGQRVQRPVRRAPMVPQHARDNIPLDTDTWQCHLCTFRNHPLLDKCEECEMPRILVGTSQSDTQDSGYHTLNEARNSACVL